MGPRGGGGVRRVLLGCGHAWGLPAGGRGHCWGDDAYGQLGDGTQEQRLTPVSVRTAPGGPPLESAQALSLGFLHSCAVLTRGEVKCWGWNSYGQLGDNTQL